MMTVFNTWLGGILRISSKDFFAEDMCPGETTLYIVEGESDFEMYLGGKAMKSGGASPVGVATVHLSGVSGTVGKMEEEEES